MNFLFTTTEASLISLDPIYIRLISCIGIDRLRQDYLRETYFNVSKLQN